MEGALLLPNTEHSQFKNTGEQWQSVNDLNVLDNSRGRRGRKSVGS
jgi:hypothetical protein